MSFNFHNKDQCDLVVGGPHNNKIIVSQEHYNDALFYIQGEGLNRKFIVPKHCTVDARKKSNRIEKISAFEFVNLMSTVKNEKLNKKKH